MEVQGVSSMPWLFPGSRHRLLLPGEHPPTLPLVWDCEVPSTAPVCSPACSPSLTPSNCQPAPSSPSPQPPAPSSSAPVVHTFRNCLSPPHGLSFSPGAVVSGVCPFMALRLPSQSHQQPLCPLTPRHLSESTDLLLPALGTCPKLLGLSS